MDHYPLARRRLFFSGIALPGAAGATLQPGLIAHDALTDDVCARVLDLPLSDTAGRAEFAAHLDAAAAA
jgi:hypothetical protein